MPVYSLRRHSVILLIIFALVLLTAPLVRAALDRNQRCVANADSLLRAFAQYSQDYDEQFPTAAAYSSLASLKTVLLPYVKQGTAFQCPANGNAPYTFNAALAGLGNASVSYNDTTEVLRDSKPHLDGRRTVAFLDGHVELGGVTQNPADTDPYCRQRVEQITRGLAQYLQDYDETLPIQQNDDDFRQVVIPYLKSKSVWTCPDTNLLYTLLDKKYRGATLASIPSLMPIITVQDPVPHKSGIVTTGYLDGYVEQRDAKGNIVPPAELQGPQKSLTAIKKLDWALLQYSQDWDERLPIYNSYPELLPILKPYLGKSDRNLLNFMQPTFQVNTNYSGVPQASIANPSETVLLRDVFDFGDGLITVGYADGHAVRVPRYPRLRRTPR